MREYECEGCGAVMALDRADLGVLVPEDREVYLCPVCGAVLGEVELMEVDL